MKKLFAPLLVPLLAFVLFACGSVPSNSPDSSGTPDLSSSPAITAPDSSEIPGLPEATETKLPPEVAALYADADLNDPYGPNYILHQVFGSPRICINF